MAYDTIQCNEPTNDTTIFSASKNMNTNDAVVDVPEKLKPKEYAYMRKILSNNTSNDIIYQQNHLSKLNSK